MVTALYARGVPLNQLELERRRVLTVLPRNLVHEGFGRELVGGHAITAQRIGAHAGVAINLFLGVNFTP